MTRDEVLAMKPGRELDALVAEKIFGVNNPDARWSPSTEISAAFEVVEKMEQRGWFVTVRNKACSFHYLRDGFVANGTGIIVGNTIPEAISKAALLAVMGE